MLLRGISRSGTMLSVVWLWTQFDRVTIHVNGRVHYTHTPWKVVWWLCISIIIMEWNNNSNLNQVPLRLWAHSWLLLAFQVEWSAHKMERIITQECRPNSECLKMRLGTFPCGLWHCAKNADVFFSLHADLGLGKLSHDWASAGLLRLKTKWHPTKNCPFSVLCDLAWGTIFCSRRRTWWRLARLSMMQGA